MLRFRVSEIPSAVIFLSVGRDTADAIRAILQRLGRSLEEFESVLDFGCGCGRTLIWLARDARGTTFYGTDVDEEAIAWCRAHIPDARFEVNGPVPPMAYPDERFDLIFGISVLTHLSEEHQSLWLRDLRRVVKPGGLVLLSMHGESAWNWLTESEKRELRRTGFLFKTSPKLQGILPDWYHTAYHSKDYVLRKFASEFQVLDYQEAAMGYQDVVVLQRV